MVDMFERSKLKLKLCEVLKTDYVVLLAQRGIGASTLVKELITSPLPVTDMKFVFASLPQWTESHEEFVRIYTENLAELCSELYKEKPDNLLKQDTVDERLIKIINYLGKKVKAEKKYLVIVLDDLANCEQESLNQLLGILTAYHKEISIGGGGERIRFLIVGGRSLWKLYSSRNNYDSEYSLVDIAQPVYLGGLSYRDISGYLPDRTLKERAILLSLTDGVPSLVKSLCEEEECEDISPYFADIRKHWRSLSPETQDALKSTIKSSQQLPELRKNNFDNECQEIRRGSKQGNTLVKKSL